MPFKLQKFGLKRHGVEIKGTKVNITGNPQNSEVETFSIQFPFGTVDVTRAQDGVSLPDYWVHIYINHPDHSAYCPDEDCGPFTNAGEIKDARLDQIDKHSADSDLGDFNRPQLYHLALKIGKREEK